MDDLNAHLFYKAGFRLETMDTQGDFLWKFIRHIRRWILDRYPEERETLDVSEQVWRMWEEGNLLSLGRMVVLLKSLRHVSEDGLISWACKVTETGYGPAGYAPRDWMTEIGFQQLGPGSAMISLLIRYRDSIGFIGRLQPPPEPVQPELVQQFLDDPELTVYMDDTKYTGAPVRLDAGAFDRFWDLLCDRERSYPVVYVSPRICMDEAGNMTSCRPLVDPVQLTQLMGPNAFVYYTEDVGFCRRMQTAAEDIGYGCCSGAVRVYQPHMNPARSGDAYRHQEITARSIADYGYDATAVLHRALAQNWRTQKSLIRLSDVRDMERRDRLNARQEARIAQVEQEFLDSSMQQEDLFKAKVDKLVEEQLQLEIDKEDLLEEIARLNADRRNLQQLAEVYRTEASRSLERKNALDRVRHMDKYPETPAEIVAYFETHFGDVLAFTDRAKASLNSCITAPQVLWDALYQMATLLHSLYEDDSVTQVDKAFNQQSKLQIARGEGKMTHKSQSLAKQYEDVYEGRSINIEPHLKTNENKESSPRFLRIYYGYEPELHKIVIGSIGKHMDNYTTQRVK